MFCSDEINGVMLPFLFGMILINYTSCKIIPNLYLKGFSIINTKNLELSHRAVINLLAIKFSNFFLDLIICLFLPLTLVHLIIFSSIKFFVVLEISLPSSSTIDMGSMNSNRLSTWHKISFGLNFRKTWDLEPIDNVLTS